MADFDIGHHEASCVMYQILSSDFAGVGEIDNFQLFSYANSEKFIQSYILLFYKNI